MELQVVKQSNWINQDDLPLMDLLDQTDVLLNTSKPFIESNTMEVSLQHLHNDCIIPVFAKDNEKTIAHQEFIDATIEVAKSIFGNTAIGTPEIRVSHQIKGRIPEAIRKDASSLLDYEKTVYYERMAFVAQIRTVIEHVGGNPLTLTFGGVRSHNTENLFNKKGMEKFKFFIGFKNMVCCNLCVSTDGFAEEIKATNIDELQSKIAAVIHGYNSDHHLYQMNQLTTNSLNENQFAQLLGRCRLYQYLPKEEKKNIPLMLFNDGQLNTVAKDYYDDETFSRSVDGGINLWKMYNLFTHANKSSYIDTFLNRDANAFTLSKGILEALINPNSPYSWYLS